MYTFLTGHMAELGRGCLALRLHICSPLIAEYFVDWILEETTDQAEAYRSKDCAPLYRLYPITLFEYSNR